MGPRGAPDSAARRRRGCRHRGRVAALDRVGRRCGHGERGHPRCAAPGDMEGPGSDGRRRGQQHADLARDRARRRHRLRVARWPRVRPGASAWERARHGTSRVEPAHSQPPDLRDRDAPWRPREADRLAAALPALGYARGLPARRATHRTIVEGIACLPRRRRRGAASDPHAHASPPAARERSRPVAGGTLGSRRSHRAERARPGRGRR